MGETKFKQTEIGKISEDWNECTLEDIAIFKNGKKSPSRDDKSCYSVFGSNGIIGSSDKYNSEKGTVIIGRVGSYCGSIYYSKNKCWVTDNAIIGVAKNENISDFLYYLLLNLNLNRHRGGSGQPLLNQGILNAIDICIPPTYEQKVIAKILSDLDSKIDLNQQMNKTLEAIGQALFKRWFIDFEFPNENGQPYKSSGGETTDSEFGEIPKGWRIGKLSETLSSLESGKRPKGGIVECENGVPSIGAENIQGMGYYNYSKTKYIPRDFFHSMRQGKVESEDVLLYKDGAQIGRKSFFMNDFPFKECAVNEHVFILRSIGNFSQIYLYFWLDQEEVTSKIINLNSNCAQPGINKTAVNSLDILIPDSNTMTMFDSLLKPLMKLLFVNCKENLVLSQIRDSLLPRLMSGRVRIPVN